VFVATGLNFPDALTGGPAAAWHEAPILLVAPDAIPEATRVELARLAPQRIVVLGGTQAVSETVMADLGDYTAGPVERWSGPDRFATAAEISARLVAPGALRVYVATGLNFPDALTGGPAAAQDGAPILLVAPDAIPDATAAELTRLAPAEVVVLGGTAAVSNAVMAALTELTDVPVIRWSGPDRFATAAEVSAQSFAGDARLVFVATGRNFPDALTGSAVAGQAHAPILLVTDAAIPDATRVELERLRPVSIVVLGGEAAVGAPVMAELDAYLR
jgi:putative cell wall-binding protein